LLTQHCIIDAKITAGIDAGITAPENAKNTAFNIPGYMFEVNILTLIPKSNCLDINSI
jgi:hypothetical protein